jgi:hypothetical protein
MKDCLGPWDNMEGKLRDLSGVCSALWKTRNLESDIADDLAAFHAPSECDAMAFADIEKIRAKIAAQWGWDLVALENELLRRIDGRWMWMSGMGDLCNVSERKVQ